MWIAIGCCIMQADGRNDGVSCIRTEIENLAARWHPAMLFSILDAVLACTSGREPQKPDEHTIMIGCSCGAEKMSMGKDAKAPRTGSRGCGPRLPGGRLERSTFAPAQL